MSQSQTDTSDDLLHPHEVFEWKLRELLPKGILGIAFFSLVTIAAIVCAVGFYITYNEGNPAVGINKACYYSTIERTAAVVLGCSKDPKTFIEPIKDEIRTVTGEISCARKVMDHGNHEMSLFTPVFGDMTVETTDGSFHCSRGFDPSETDIPKAINGLEDLALHVAKDPNYVSNMKAVLAGGDYKTSKIGQAVHVKMGTLANLKERLADAEAGHFDPICKSKSHKEELEKFMCAHVILGQIPQGPDCYNRKDARHVNTELLPMIQEFERGDLSAYQGEAELERFKHCAKLLDTYVIGASLSPEQLLLERESKIENERYGFKAHEKCRRFD